MGSDVKKGFFFVADISGYTKFLAETELAHAKGILEELFDALLPTIKAPIKISGLRGDAVFAYAIADDIVAKQYMLDISEKVYCAFAEKKERIKINTSCTCKACANLDALDLKVFIHHGEFILQKSGDTEELAGTDVNTIFRLMKNDVVKDTGIEAYALITCEAVRQMDLGDFFPKEAFHRASYEHIGEVEFIVHDLHAAWQKNHDAKRVYLSADDEQLCAENTMSIPFTPDAAFTICTRPELRKEWVQADMIEELHNKGKVVQPGSIYHCHHGKDIFIFEIIDWRPGEYLTGVYRLPMGMSIQETTELVPFGEGTLIKMRYGPIQSKNFVGKVMAKLMTSKCRKLFSAAGGNCKEGMARLCDKLKEANPDIIATPESLVQQISVAEAVDAKMSA